MIKLAKNRAIGVERPVIEPKTSPNRALAEAVRRHQAGTLAAAEAPYRALPARPTDADLRSVVISQRGNPAAGVRTLADLAERESAFISFAIIRR